MSLFDAMSIAQTGMSAAVTQLNVSAKNIANSDTGGYVPERVDYYTHPKNISRAFGAC